MFIPSIEINKEESSAIFYPKWIYVADDMISTIWNDIIKPYKKDLNKIFGESFLQVLNTPMHKLESPDDLEEYCEYANSMYFTEDPDNDLLVGIGYIDNTPGITFNMHTMHGEAVLSTAIRYYLTILFAQRVQIMFNSNHNRDIDVMYLLTPPSTIESAASLLKKLNSKYFKNFNCVHIAASNTYVKCDKDADNNFGNMCKKIGNAVSKSIQYPDKIDKYVNDFMIIKNNDFHILIGTPITFSITNSHTDSFKRRFRTLLYKNGKLVKEKHDVLTKSKYLLMQMDLLKLLDEGDPNDRWVLINGIINYINE